MKKILFTVLLVVIILWFQSAESFALSPRITITNIPVQACYDLASYIPKLENPKHLIIHPDEFFDEGPFAKEGIEHIIKHICSEDEKNCEIPGCGGWRGSKHFPPSYLDSRFLKLKTSDDAEKVDEFILNAEEIILSGGGYDDCHKTWFRELLAIRLKHGKRTVLHFPLDAIYPRNKYIPFAYLETSTYMQAFKYPYSCGLLNLQEAIEQAKREGKDILRTKFDEIIPAAVFYNGAQQSQWKNPDFPMVIVNYWDSVIAMRNSMKPNQLIEQSI